VGIEKSIFERSFRERAGHPWLVKRSERQENYSELQCQGPKPGGWEDIDDVLASIDYFQRKHLAPTLECALKSLNSSWSVTSGPWFVLEFLRSPRCN
jgi:hypothetical protein